MAEGSLQRKVPTERTASSTSPSSSAAQTCQQPTFEDSLTPLDLGQEPSTMPARPPTTSNIRFYLSRILRSIAPIVFTSPTSIAEPSLCGRDSLSRSVPQAASTGQPSESLWARHAAR